MTKTTHENPNLPSARPAGSAVPMRVQGGWIVDFDFLQEIATAIENDDDGLSLEMVEAVIIELNKRGCLRIAPPNK